MSQVLFHAISQVDIASVERLANKWNVNDRRENGDTPLHLAILVQPSSFFEGEDIALRLQIMKLLISRGADVNATDDRGDTPLHIAAAWGHNAEIRLLVASGADLYAKNKNGDTPSDTAEETYTRQGGTGFNTTVYRFKSQTPEVLRELKKVHRKKELKERLKFWNGKKRKSTGK